MSHWIIWNFCHIILTVNPGLLASLNNEKLETVFWLENNKILYFQFSFSQKSKAPLVRYLSVMLPVHVVIMPVQASFTLLGSFTPAEHSSGHSGTKYISSSSRVLKNSTLHFHNLVNTLVSLFWEVTPLYCTHDRTGRCSAEDVEEWTNVTKETTTAQHFYWVNSQGTNYILHTLEDCVHFQYNL